MTQALQCTPRQFHCRSPSLNQSQLYVCGSHVWHLPYSCLRATFKFDSNLTSANIKKSFKMQWYVRLYSDNQTRTNTWWPATFLSHARRRHASRKHEIFIKRKQRAQPLICCLTTVSHRPMRAHLLSTAATTNNKDQPRFAE